MLHYTEFFTPYLAVDYDALTRNIARLKEFGEQAGVNLRPHVKTHKCTEIARLQIEAGAIGVTCAKLGEAEAMVQGGIHDILIANQVNGKAKLLRLAEISRIADVKVAVDSPFHVKAISEAATFVGSAVPVVIEIDVGMGRCGVRTKDEALNLVQLIESLPNIRFSGLLGYEGHAVMLTPKEVRLEVCTRANQKLIGVRRYLEAHGYSVGLVSAGGTGTFDITGTCKGITEIEAGSYVLMDAKYGSMGLPFEQALFVVSTVISTPEEGVCVIDAGLKAVTPEFGNPVPVGIIRCATCNEQKPEPLAQGELEVKVLSEEHAILKVSNAGSTVSVGDKILLVPGHVCTTVNLYDEFYVFSSGRFLRKWSIEARGANF